LKIASKKEESKPIKNLITPMESIPTPPNLTDVPTFDPFNPVDPNLLVSDSLFSTHNLVLNKYCIVPYHLLVTTKDFQPQTDALNFNDLKATVSTMVLANELKPLLGFYNCGPVSGGSQPHKHLQVLPMNNKGSAPIFEVWNKHQDQIEEGKLTIFTNIKYLLNNILIGKSNQIIELPFHHFITKFSDFPQTVAEVDDFIAKILPVYEEMLNQTQTLVSNSNPGRISYNFLISSSYMMILPRSQEGFILGGRFISVNSLGVAHMMLAIDSQQVEDYKLGLEQNSSSWDWFKAIGYEKN
jgi:ATP adenylyltransferase